MKYYLAIDLGASSGRHIVGWREGDEIQTCEVYRFPNGMQTQDGHLIWDVDALVSQIRVGIDKAVEKYGGIESLSIDTWGVDYVLLNGEKEILPCYAYRDDRTEAAIRQVHAILPFEELYRRTGVQFQPFTTVYQLYADKLAGRLEKATDCLMMPEYLLYKLCGVKAHEYTIQTTSGLVSAKTGVIDEMIVDALGLPRHLFGKLCRPGTVLGEYKGIRCVLCATHDTGSAVEGIPMQGNHPYISSGTWSLLGIKSEAPVVCEEGRLGNWSNEGGVGYTRFQKNIMGMWLVNRLRDELCPQTDFASLVSEAQASAYTETVDVNDAAFLAPKSMRAAFDAALEVKPQTVGDYFACAYKSLALCYAQAVKELEQIAQKRYECIYIVGGGAKNEFLNRLTQETSKKQVVALPIEAAAIGSIKIQMEVDK